MPVSLFYEKTCKIIETPIWKTIEKVIHDQV